MCLFDQFSVVMVSLQLNSGSTIVGTFLVVSKNMINVTSRQAGKAELGDRCTPKPSNNMSDVRGSAQELLLSYSIIAQIEMRSLI